MPLITEPGRTFVDDSNRILTNGTVTFGEAGTGSITLKATYPTHADYLAGTNANDNPMSVESDGRLPNQAHGSGVYRVVVKDSLGNTISDDSDVNAGLTESSGVTVGTISYPIVDTIAALKALDTTKSTRAFVMGYSAVGDGSAGHYRYNSGSSTADNGGTVIQPTVGSGRWELIHEGPISPKQFGAIGDGSANDTTAITAVLDGKGPLNTIDLDDGRYSTTSLDLSLGPQFTGSGFIYKSNVVKTPWGRRQPLMFGAEYLYALHTLIIANSAWRVTLTGDSTTSGTSATSPFLPDELILTAARRMGAVKGVAVNRGQSGKATSDWLATYLTGDLTPQPHLLIVRWGLNDPYTASLTPAQTIANIRTGLATVRATYGVKDLAILLCTPNSASDSTNGRDERWAEQIIHGYRQAAMDYQCAFIDLYSLFQDSRGGTYASGNAAASLWMDDLFADGRAIHPKNFLNARIYAAIGKFVFEGCQLYGSSAESHEAGASLTKVATDLPATYNLGTSLYRIDTGSPRNGFVHTLNHTDDGQFQMAWGFSSQVLRSVRTRFGRTATWDPWDGEYIVPTLSNSWVNYSAAALGVSYTRDMYGRVYLSGTIKDGTATTGTTLFTLPAGYRPALDVYASAATSGAYGQAKITASTGVVSIVAGNNTYFSLDGINFLAAL